MERKLDVFLCCTTEDMRTANELYERLKSEGWIEPWLNNKNILPGQNRDSEIEKTIDKAHVIIIFLSRIAVVTEGHFQTEINLAAQVYKTKPEGTIYIIPLKLESCQAPTSLNEIHPLNYYESGAYDKLLQSLGNRKKQIEDNILTSNRLKPDFEFVCEVCRKLVDSSKDEARIYIASEDLMKAEKKSEDLENLKGLQSANLFLDSHARWRVSHYSCNPDADTYYEIEIYRIKTFLQVIKWTSHLMWKKWFDHTDWPLFLSKLVEQHDPHHEL